MVQKKVTATDVPNKMHTEHEKYPIKEAQFCGANNLKKREERIPNVLC